MAVQVSQKNVGYVDEVKHDLCMRMYDNWTSEHMRRARCEVWRAIKHDAKLEGGHRARVIDQIGTIKHFMADLNKLIKFIRYSGGSKELAELLFRDYVEDWCNLFETPEAQHYLKVDHEPAWINKNLDDLRRNFNIENNNL